MGAGVSRVSTSPSRSLVWTRRSKARPCVSRSSTPTVSRGIRCWESCCSRWTKPTFAARLLTTLESRTVKVPRPDLSRDRSFSPSLGVDQQTFWLGCVGHNFDLGFDPEAKISATTNIEAKISGLTLGLKGFVSFQHQWRPLQRFSAFATASAVYARVIFRRAA